MKKVLSVMAVSAFVLTAGVALAGGPGKKATAACPEACQQQIDDLNSSQAQQNDQLKNHEGRISALEKNAYNAWYARIGARATWGQQNVEDVHGVGNIDNWKNDTGWGGALAFGRQFGQFRTEIELASQKADLKKNDTATGDNTLTTVMLNGYYEIPVFDAFALYGMAGLGYGKYDINAKDNGVPSVDNTDSAFAYKAGAGMTYNFTDAIAGDLGYEYLGTTETTYASNINTHNVVASVRFKF